MDNTQISLFIELLKAGRTHTLQVADSVPETHRFKQLAEGKATPTWLLGHLARTIDRIVIGWTLQQDSILGEELGKRFAPAQVDGDPPTTNPDDYPPWDDVKELYIKTMRTAIEGLAALTDADLDKPLPGDLPAGYRERFSSIGVALKLLVAHDAYHRGQMGLLAKLT